LIDEFKTGMMPLAEGTSMRMFLAKMLNCHPMRISKKFVGSNYAGKSVYTRLPESRRLSDEQVQVRRAKMCELERKFLAKIQGKAGAAATPCVSSLEEVLASIGGKKNAPASASRGHAEDNTLGCSSGLEMRNLINQATTTTQQLHAATGAELPPLNINFADSSFGGFGSTQSMQDLFSDLVNSNSNGNLLGTGLNPSSSLQACQFLAQQQQQQQQPNFSISGTTQHTQHHRANSRAAAAGRALLERGGGLSLGSVLGGASDHATASMMKPPSMTIIANKPLAEYTTAELAAELRTRSSLTDLIASLSGGTGSARNDSQGSPGSLKDSLQQTQSANAFSTLMRNASLASSIDMSNFMERQGSIDSLSNSAIRSHLQSLQSMGSFLDPTLEGGGQIRGNNGHRQKNNSTWTPSCSATMDQGSSGMGIAPAEGLNMNDFLAVNAGDMFGGNGHTGNFMQSFSTSEQLRNAISNSGLDLASLLNNEDALRRLEALPSSLNHSFCFHGQGNNSAAASQRGGPGNDPSYLTAAAFSDQNTAIAQFLSQKKLMEQQQSGGGNSCNRFGGGSNLLGGVGGNDDEQERRRSMAAAPGVGGSSNNAGGSASMNPAMSSLLSTLQSRGGNSANADQRAPPQGIESHGVAHGRSNNAATMDALKRKFLSGGACQEELLTAMEEHRRNKPFR
jgi:hypothetical protein